MLANFTHDLKSPLGVIKFSSTTLLRDDVAFDRETTRELLADIDAQTDRLTNIVERVLDLERLESSGVQLHRERIGVTQIAEGVAASMQRSLERHRIILDIVPPNLATYADAGRIEEVVANLLDNAVKYSPRGGDIRVTGRPSGGEIVVTVADQGIGIPEEDLERIFERFYRVSRDLAPDVHGVGLGLPVCRGIVEAHGGRIWAESPAGGGAIVSFTLPTA